MKMIPFRSNGSGSRASTTTTTRLNRCQRSGSGSTLRGRCCRLFQRMWIVGPDAGRALVQESGSGARLDHFRARVAAAEARPLFGAKTAAVVHADWRRSCQFSKDTHTQNIYIHAYVPMTDPITPLTAMPAACFGEL